MEKKRYEVTIAEVELSIISDEREEFVMRLVNNLDAQIKDIIGKNKRSSKMDAALLTALDYNCERIKAEKRVRNLEAQIALYDANLRRMREENIKLRKMLLDGGKEIPAQEEEEETDITDVPVTDAKDAKAAAGKENQMKIDVNEGEVGGREDKLRQIADLFHRAPADTEKPKEEGGDTRADKLGAIEDLLKSKKN